ncbi:mCG1028219, partial [Mus musculus]
TFHPKTPHPKVRTLPTKNCSKNIFEIKASWNNLKMNRDMTP